MVCRSFHTLSRYDFRSNVIRPNKPYINPQVCSKKKSASPDTRRYPDHLHVVYALFNFFIKYMSIGLDKHNFRA